MIDASGQAAVRPVRAEREYRRFGLHNTRMRFQRWRRTRPFWGGFWAMLGGLVIAYGPSTAFKLLLVAGTAVWLGVLIGVLVMVFGLFLWIFPRERHLTGVVIVALACVSLITSDFGGFIIGMVFAMIGGSMGFAWVPTQPKVKRRRRLLARERAVPTEADVTPAPGAAVLTMAEGAIETGGVAIEREPSLTVATVEVAGHDAPRTDPTGAQDGIDDSVKRETASVEDAGAPS